MTKTGAQMLLRIFFGLLCFSAVSMAIANDAKPLFAEDTVLKIRINAPFREIVRKAPEATDAHAAEIAFAGEAHAIALSARGNSRRDPNICKFPPLRVEFNEKPGETSIFNGQKRLKLVTHCRSSRRYQQYYLLEYAAYKLLNVMTPLSLRVRLAEIDYVEADTGKTIISRFGFFIEDADDAAKRNGVKEIDIERIDIGQLNVDAAVRVAVFQYMIGNLDWSMTNGPPGENCCHNAKLIGARAEPLRNIVPVPYDFDYSGLVDAPYAVPPESVSIRSVRTRRYRGFCVHSSQALEAAAAFGEKRGAIYAALDAVQGLEERNKKSARRYLDGFFENIADGKKFEAHMLKYCRK